MGGERGEGKRMGGEESGRGGGRGKTVGGEGERGRVKLQNYYLHVPSKSPALCGTIVLLLPQYIGIIIAIYLVLEDIPGEFNT